MDIETLYFTLPHVFRADPHGSTRNLHRLCGVRTDLHGLCRFQPDIDQNKQVYYISDLTWTSMEFYLMLCADQLYQNVDLFRYSVNISIRKAISMTYYIYIWFQTLSALHQQTKTTCYNFQRRLFSSIL